MSNEDQETEIDETANFVTTSSDEPVIAAEPQDEGTEEESASSDDQDTEGAESDNEENETDAGEETAAEPETKKGKGVQKRLNELTRERENERRRAEAAEAKLAEIEAKANDKPEGKEPKEDDFDTYDEYLDALDAYEKPETKAEKSKETDDKEDKSALTDDQKTAMAVVKEAVDAADKPEDFEDVALDPDVPITGTMLEALAETENPAGIMYKLGKDKSLAESISKKTPMQQMREIAKLELTVAKAPPKPVKITNSPDPIDPVGGSAAQEKGLSEMSFAEFEAKRNKEEAGRGDSGW